MENYYIFEAVNIEKKLNKKTFLKNISFSLEKGDRLAVLGDNGSGKSTLLTILAGISPFESGEIRSNGAVVSEKERLKIAYVPQEPVFVDYLTVKDNLKLWASIYKKSNMLENVPNFLGIEKMLSKKISALSGGMKKKVSIAVALMNNPEVLIMDEAFAALDSKSVENLVYYLKNSNITLIYSSHSVYDIMELCTEAIVLKQGKINFQTPKNISLDNEKIKYLYSKF